MASSLQVTINTTHLQAFVRLHTDQSVRMTVSLNALDTEAAAISTDYLFPNGPDANDEDLSQRRAVQQKKPGELPQAALRKLHTGHTSFTSSKHLEVIDEHVLIR